ncbi:phospholipase D/nuclease [Aaosphaeria arxii CBS 175.79]|uniref:Phospholipase D/nuclease n=1 Tax=Aaosphaeria arxii CBS 175.79 TaxID=1450172 RepID=A0A6A5Y3F8_9PLEO|nr:phospholipase D/nuclease [Aaosphaeria arxii CBS 175.79]KAF2019391.1 phospholipase D/nuclease [Aaosphaeria arxii CBS 175.79]
MVHEGPPRKRQRLDLDSDSEQQPMVKDNVNGPNKDSATNDQSKKALIPSPVQLTKIGDLAPHQNVDTVTLHDILGDPKLIECWNFNYLFDVDFVLRHFDPRVRNLIQLKIIHGFWRRDDDRRHRLYQASERHPNVELTSAYMPDPFGTHHCKMLILFRNDGQAQVVIHTANMISRDWANMTQAVWRSPLLPLLSNESGASLDNQSQLEIGSGERFKSDLLRYLGAYENRLKELRSKLQEYDFSSIRAAFIASTPSRGKPESASPATQTSWGWPGVREILSTIPVMTKSASSKDTNNTPTPNLVVQVSSIATLGQAPTWLDNFRDVLSTSPNPPKVASFSNAAKAGSHAKPKFNIIFPTAEEIRRSLDGYGSGASIHTKIQSKAQQKQLEYLRPLFCHWNNFNEFSQSSAISQPQSLSEVRRAERGYAAPHIKTYVRFHDESQQKIDWAMVTSANLSKQAWGDITNKKGEVWIQSWETGVIVWPALFGTPDSPCTSMIPVFGKDTPEVESVESPDLMQPPGQSEDPKRENSQDLKKETQEAKQSCVGFRMPYDLPLKHYGESEEPWCATSAYTEPDWKDQVWNGY